MIAEFAPAKLNLALHVTGKRQDGYHLLDSAVMFAADAGDRLALKPAETTSLAVDGPFSQGLECDTRNLVLQAHAALARRFPGQVQACSFTLTKNLPVASGIGGGSADAAAALRGIMRMNSLVLGEDDLSALALTLGADVPVCLSSVACRMRGIGEVIDAWHGPPQFHAVLVNPLVGVSTAAVFRSLQREAGSATHEPIADRGFAQGDDTANCIDWLKQCRNDLEPAARQLQPQIDAVLGAMTAQPGCALARMSGSGATCFSLFDDATAASAAARQLQAQHGGWWVAMTALK